MSGIQGGQDPEKTPPKIKNKIAHTKSKIEALGYTIQHVGAHDYLALPGSE